MPHGGTSLARDERSETGRRIQHPPAVVFSRLEPSLLDESSQARALLQAAIARLADAGVPVVAASRGTRAEIELLRAELGLADPFIAENGAAVFVPRGYFPFTLPASGIRSGYHSFERSIAHDAVVRALRRAANQARVSVVGFSDMSISEVARECGISLLQARLAKLREYDEPFRVVDHEAAARARLLKTLRGAGLQVWTDMRFDHVAGSADMAACVALLRSLYARRGRLVAVGVGATEADLEFLRRVDVPVLVPERAARPPAALLRAVPGARVARLPGVEGWVEAIEEALQRVALARGARAVIH